MEEIKPQRVCIVVLGDVGRSPRMSYHALSFAESNFQVELVGYKGTALLETINQNNLIHLHYIPATPGCFAVLPRFLTYILKTIWQFFVLLYLLLSLEKCDFYIMQNPPATPTLPVLWLVSFIKKSKFVIDWHNYAYTLLGLSLGKNNFLVKITFSIERFFGQKADINMCVSEAMKQDLADKWNISATTVYDRPAEQFHPISVEEQHEVLMKISKRYPIFAIDTVTDPTYADVEDHSNMTLVTEKSNNSVTKLAKRYALVISSTSWTEDEDFSVLISALEKYEEQLKTDETLPKMLCVITGQGPMKQHYISQIASKKFTCIKFCMPWVEPEDYPKLLASADLGVCLHSSSSGLDLPMKVVDMFGCQLPVCAIKYNSISELVKHNVNGMVFEDGAELYSQWKELLSGFPGDMSVLNRLKAGLEDFMGNKWSPYWKSHVLPLFSDAATHVKQE